MQPPKTRSKERQVLFVVNDARFFVTHRLSLAKGIRESGYAVHLATPTKGYSSSVTIIEKAGFPIHEVGIERQGTNPLRDMAAFASLLRLYRALRPDIVHHVTVKPVLYGSLAAHVAGIPGVINAISGLGRLFVGHDFASRVRARAMRGIYRLALRHPNAITIFQNSEDRADFIRAGIVDEASSALIEGSGTELRLFDPLSAPEEPPIIVLPARILHQKGAREFIAAARLLKAEGTTARFAMVGDSAGNRDAVPIQELEAVQKEGAIELWGWADDMASVMRRAAIVCLPSYHEGLPKALIDACAAGRPIVATDIAGCRAVVTDGMNGILVPPRDVISLANALRILILDPAMRERMGKSGLGVAIARFDVAHIIASTLEVYAKLQHQPCSASHA